MSHSDNRTLSRRALLAGSAAAAALAAGCGHMMPWGGKKKPEAPPVPTVTPSTQLKTTLDTLTVAWLRHLPETSTSLGVSEAQAGGPYQNRLRDYSTAEMQRVADIQRTAIASLAKIDRSGLAAQEVISVDVVREGLSTRLAGAAFPWGRSGFFEPAPYHVSQIDGAYIDIPSLMDAQHPLRNATDVATYLDRMVAFAGVLDQETVNIAADAGHGVVPPDFVIDGALKQLKGITSKKPDANVLVVSLRNRIGQTGMDKAASDKALQDAESIVQQRIVPALSRQIDEFTKIRNGATHDAGIWRLKDGDKFYAAALRAHTTSPMQPEEIHQMGLALCKEIDAGMDSILKSQGLKHGSIADRVQHLFKDPKQMYPNTDKGRAKLIADLNAQIAALQPLLVQNFGVQAKAKLEIVRVPPFKEAGSAGGYYEPGSLDGSRPGRYYVNLRDTHEWPKFTLPTLTYHEGEPGHHWQGSIALENPELPLIRQSLFWFSGYGEGWAHYAEELCDEMGCYKNDPWGRLGYLKDAGLRAARLVVDTGMHTKQWSREKCIDFMIQVNGDSRSATATEVERYAVWPGQACSYMIGRETIKKLRADAKAKLGGNFDIKKFHDVVLTNGAMPLSTLTGVVGGWVAAQTGAPAAPHA